MYVQISNFEWTDNDFLSLDVRPQQTEARVYVCVTATEISSGKKE